MAVAGLHVRQGSTLNTGGRAICDDMAAASFTVDGESVQPYNDEHFFQVRQRYGAALEALADPQMFSFSMLRDGGGKGGDLLAFTSDRRYIVKEVGGSDQETLLRVTEALVRHVCTALGGSLIARFFMHFRRPRDGKDYVVMNNWLPPTGRQQWAEVYDLKGSADDKLMERNGERVQQVHKRCWHVHKYMKCCWSEERHQYYWGKQHAYEVPFHVTPHDREVIMQMIEQDARFMREQQLMDYSIIVGVQRVEDYSPGQDCGFSDSPSEGQPYTCVHDNTASAYYLGVIDFLQSWTGTKKLAMMIKKPVAPQPQSTVPPDEYALQFIRHFDQKFVGDAASLPGVGAALPGTYGQHRIHGSAGLASQVVGRAGGSAVDTQGVRMHFAGAPMNDGATDMV